MQTLGGVEITKLDVRQERLAMLLWGKSGCGKTVLASTCPRPILWLNFDPDGPASLRRTDGIIVADLSKLTHDKVPQFKQGEVIEAQLRAMFKQDQSIQTVVVDSVTSFAQMALAHAVLSGKANGGSFKASMETPGMQGYGIRNRLVLDAINMLLRLTAEYQKHIVFVCHEDTPAKDAQGQITSITLLLGGSLPEEVPLKISECWHLLDSDGKRMIGIRPYAMRAPMRTRMFRANGRAVAFPFTYDQDQDDKANDGKRIADWYTAWAKAGFNKIASPA